MTSFHLGYELAFDDLHEREGLVRLDAFFLTFLHEEAPALVPSLQEARKRPEALSTAQESALILLLAPYVEDFLSKLFQIQEAVHVLQKRHYDLAPLLACRRQFVQKRVAPFFVPEKIQGVSAKTFAAFLALEDLEFAQRVLSALETKDEAYLAQAASYAAWRCFAEEARPLKKRSPLFTLPQKTDFDALFPFEGETLLKTPSHLAQRRDGFDLTDLGVSFEDAMKEAASCLYCHQRGKDSCSKGMPSKKSTQAPQSPKAPPPFAHNPLGIPLTGCPLEQKISEMAQLRQEGFCLGSLATAMIDNPLLAATGERICNDCEKACIFQKQDPIKIPALETQTLKEVLALPWGAEIYSLLTRWNPLNFRYPLPKPDSGYHVLVAGMGPAGFTLSHYLLREGHHVVGIDGLKIEPLPEKAFHPIYDVYRDLFDSLEDRVIGGFGGVAEYGITARWNKNFLTLIRLILERHKAFKVFGGLRLGSQVTPEDAFDIGFDHLALCLGAGQPKLLSLHNIFAKGVRLASDFLMTLQLAGAFKRKSLANLQVRLPALVIGGGLTALDTATEILAYYPRQVERFLARYEKLCQKYGEAFVRQAWTQEDHAIAQDFLAHGHAIREERAQARLEKRPPDFQPLLVAWGGVRLLYRKHLTDSPGYRLNHEEVFKAFQEGVTFQEETLPLSVHLDAYGAFRGLQVQCGKRKEWLPGRSLFLALGTQPNAALPEMFPEVFSQEAPFGVGGLESLKGLEGLEGRVSFFGDMHPDFSGSVVKAMASAKYGYPGITASLLKRPPLKTSTQVFEKIQKDWVATVEAVRILGPQIVEVRVKAPAAARHFKPGHFFRLQNFEHFAPSSPHATMALESLALTGAQVDPTSGVISLIVLEMGGSSNLCRHLKVGEPVVLMGPTGAETVLPGEKVILVGGGLGNAVLFSIGQSLRAAGKKVLYFAAYKKAEALFKPDDIHAAADQVVWCLEEGSLPFTCREKDLFFQGTGVDALHHHQALLKGQDSLLVIGSQGMMQAVQTAVKGPLQKALESCHSFTASLNAPMHCMMKGICAQCLQRQKDPVTGEETVIFSCIAQDQPLDKIDFEMLKDRLSQNSLQEKMTALWVAQCQDD